MVRSSVGVIGFPVQAAAWMDTRGIQRKYGIGSVEMHEKPGVSRPEPVSSPARLK